VRPAESQHGHEHAGHESEPHRHQHS
jgi:hypothetical protein